MSKSRMFYTGLPDTMDPLISPSCYKGLDRPSWLHPLEV